MKDNALLFVCLFISASFVDSLHGSLRRNCYDVRFMAMEGTFEVMNDFNNLLDLFNRNGGIMILAIKGCAMYFSMKA